MQPFVRIRMLDGGLGVRAPNGQPPLALVGSCTLGEFNKPASFARIADLVAARGAGPLVEAAAHAIQAHGHSVVVCRASTLGGDSPSVAEGDKVIVSPSTGDISVRESPAPAPFDDLTVRVQITRDSVVATNVWLKYSIDDGETYSPEIAVGTATFFPVPGTGVSVEFDTGTLKSGSYLTFTTAPDPVDGLGEAVQALAQSALPWRIVHVTSPVGPSDISTLSLALNALASGHKWRQCIANTRVPEPGESEAEYLDAMTTAFADAACDRLQLCSGDALLVSGVSGKEQRRPYSFDVASFTAAVQPHIDISDVNLGPQVGIRITDDNGNAISHDESLFSGLSDLRLTVARSWDAFQGVYVNDPLLLSPSGSDYTTMPNRRVIDLAAETAYPYFVRRLNRPVLADSKTGCLTEATCREIEKGCEAALDAVLGAEPMFSDRQVVVSRTDKILSTKTMHVQIFIVPLGYLKAIEVALSLTATLVQAA